MAISVKFHSPYLDHYSQDPLPFILSTLSTAQKTVDFCVDRLTLEPVVSQAALLRKRGVQVRWLIGAGQPGAEAMLAKHGFAKGQDWRVFKPGNSQLRQRFVLVDGRRVFFGSMPLSPEGLYLQDNLDAVVDSPEVGNAFQRAMNIYWTESLGNGKDYWPELVKPAEDIFVGPEQRVSAYFTPYDGNILLEKMIDVVSQAEQNIYFAFSAIAEPQLMEILEERARNGVAICGVIDARQARPAHFTQAPEMRSLVMGGKIRVMQSLSREKGGRMADTMGVNAVSIDGRWAYVGGWNFEPKASPYEAEGALVIDSGPVARQCATYVEALHALAAQGGHTRSACKNMEAYSKATGYVPESRVRPSVVAPVRTRAKVTRKRRKSAPAAATSWAKRKARANARKRAETRLSTRRAAPAAAKRRTRAAA